MSDQSSHNKIFISHSSEDNYVVHLIDDALRIQGYLTWIDYKNLNGGEDYPEKIVKAIRECDLFLIIISKASVRSLDVMRELKAADKKAKLPIFIDDLTVDTIPDIYQYFLTLVQTSRWKPGQDTRILLDEVSKLLPGSEHIVKEDNSKYIGIGIRKNSEAKTYHNHFCNDPMFLNKGNRKLTLDKVFQLPAFRIRNDYDDSESSFDDYFYDLLQATHLNHGEYPDQPLERVFTILGKPGTGKTSLLQYIVSNNNILYSLSSNHYHEINVLRFASLKNVLWSAPAEEMVETLLSACGYKYRSLEDLYKKLNGIVLILDGLDEVEPDISREEILQKLYDFFNCHCYDRMSEFLMIITCRSEYVTDIGSCKMVYPDIVKDSYAHSAEKDPINYITLQPLNREQIVNFCNSYNNAMKELNNPQSLKALYETSLIDQDILFMEDENSGGEYGFAEILGIPIILYMIIGNKIPIDYENKERTTVAIYDDIFKANGGIFDSSDIRNDTRIKPHRQYHESVNEELLKISKLIAIEMFLHAPDRAVCSELDLQQIVKKAHGRLSLLQNSETDSVVISEKELYKRVKGDNYLKSSIQYIEGTNQLSFVHRSIYEYFTACYIYDHMLILGNRESGADDKRAAKATLRLILQTRLPSKDIRKYLSQKLKNTEKAVRKNLYLVLHEFFEELLNSRFLFSEDTAQLKLDMHTLTTVDTDRNNPFSLMEQELVCFLNMLFLLRECYVEESGNAPYIYVSEAGSVFQNYVQQAIYMRNARNHYESSSFLHSSDYNTGFVNSCLDLSRLSMEGINLKGLDLSNVSLQHSNLRKANLEHVNFGNCSIDGADFSKARMGKSSLRKIRIVEKENPDPTNPAWHCVSFIDADLRNSDMQFSDFSGADFGGCNLGNSNLYSADLSYCNLCGSVFDGAVLKYADFYNSVFLDASLICTDLEDSNLAGAKFADEKEKHGAQLHGARFAGAVISDDTIFDKKGRADVICGDGSLPFWS